MLQAWLQILDAGVSSSLTRQTAVSKHNQQSLEELSKVFIKIIAFFAIIAVTIFCFGYSLSDTISTSWLNTNKIDSGTITSSVIFMFATLSLKYISGPLRGALLGFESHGTLSFVNFLVVTLRFPGGLGVLIILDNSLKSYFLYQAIISALEILLLYCLLLFDYKKHLNKTTPIISKTPKISIKAILVFSGQLSILSILWIVVTQIDKLVLSKVLTLENFGYYSLAVTVSGVIFTLSAPIIQVITPRLVSLATQNESQRYIKTYAISLFVYISFFLPLSFFLFSHGDLLVLAWTGDENASHISHQYIKWLALGNLAAGVMNFSYILQYSLGDIKKHLIVYSCYSLILIPITPLIAYEFGGLGVSLFYFLHNSILLTTWGGRVFYKYLKGFSRIILLVILVSAFISGLHLFLAHLLLTPPTERAPLTIFLVFIGASNALLIIGFFWIVRKYVFKKIEVTSINLN